MGIFDTEDYIDIDVEKIGAWDKEYRFWVWSRKIDDHVRWLEDRNFSDDEIRRYLMNCADMREKFLDKHDLTETEEIWTERIHWIWEKYGITDPIY